MDTYLSDFAKEKNVKYFMISYTDLFGYQRAKLVPAQAITEMQKQGAGFGGFASWLDLSPAEEELLVVPDSYSVIQLPWKKEVAWVAGNCILKNKSLSQAPRFVLTNVLQKFSELGYTVKTGVEAEFFLLNSDGDKISDSFDDAEKPCYDQQAIMRRYDIIAEICDYMHEIGWKPYQTDHEDGNGQFEINWEYDEALKTADKHSFFKFMVKSIAEKHGFRATFMPKPFPELTGNGCHVHISIWDQYSKNIFITKDNKDLISNIGIKFIGGLINYANSMMAITNPIVNSYKRTNARVTNSGATWSPNAATWSGNNRTHMIRIPANGRFELRLPDGAANPYLLQAIIASAGLLGIKYNLDPGKVMENDSYTQIYKKDKHEILPQNLLDALRSFENSKQLKSVIGEEFSRSYLMLKNNEWDAYNNHFTKWEMKNGLNI